MKWKRVDEYAIQSPPFTVSKSFHPGMILYSAWRRVPRETGGFYPAIPLGCFKSLDEAKAACK